MMQLSTDYADFKVKLERLLPPYQVGRVVDFIDFHIWPVFNVADSAIVIGALLLAVGGIRREREA